MTDFYKTSSMTDTFTKLKRFYLSTLEIPIGLTNVRTGSTDTLIFTLNGIKYLITLPEKKYSSISSLLVDINSHIASKISGVTMTFSLSTSMTEPVRVLITFSGTITTSFVMTDTTLSKYILGFCGLTSILSKK